MTLTKARRARLEKLAAYLEGLPADYRHFDMASFITDGGADTTIQYARKNGGVATCGSAACAVGHGPAAGILVPARFIQRSPFSDRVYVNWDGYAAEMFLGIGEDWFEAGSDWCFGGSWEEVDNSHYGAAARIRYLLDKGLEPNNYSGPRERHVPLYAPYRIDAKATPHAD